MHTAAPDLSPSPDPGPAPHPPILPPTSAPVRAPDQPEYSRRAGPEQTTYIATTWSTTTLRHRCRHYRCRDEPSRIIDQESLPRPRSRSPPECRREQPGGSGFRVHPEQPPCPERCRVRDRCENRNEDRYQAESSNSSENRYQRERRKGRGESNENEDQNENEIVRKHRHRGRHRDGNRGRSSDGSVTAYTRLNAVSDYSRSIRPTARSCHSRQAVRQFFCPFLLTTVVCFLRATITCCKRNNKCTTTTMTGTTGYAYCLRPVIVFLWILVLPTILAHRQDHQTCPGCPRQRDHHNNLHQQHNHNHHHHHHHHHHHNHGSANDNVNNPRNATNDNNDDNNNNNNNNNNKVNGLDNDRQQRHNHHHHHHQIRNETMTNLEDDPIEGRRTAGSPEIDRRSEKAVRSDANEREIRAVDRNGESDDYEETGGNEDSEENERVGDGAESSSDELRLEAIKHQILTKLGLRGRPDVNKTLASVPLKLALKTLYRAEGQLPPPFRYPGSKARTTTVSRTLVDSNDHVPAYGADRPRYPPVVRGRGGNVRVGGSGRGSGRVSGRVRDSSGRDGDEGDDHRDSYNFVDEEDPEATTGEENRNDVYDASFHGLRKGGTRDDDSYDEFFYGGQDFSHKNADHRRTNENAIKTGAYPSSTTFRTFDEPRTRDDDDENRNAYSIGDREPPSSDPSYSSFTPATSSSSGSASASGSSSASGFTPSSSSAPSSSSPVSASRDEPQEELDDFYARTSEIITFAEPGHTLNGQPLLEFPMSTSEPVLGPLRVKRATLWTRVEVKRYHRSQRHRQRPHQNQQRNITLWVFRVRCGNATHLRGKELGKHLELVTSLGVNVAQMGWQKFEVTDVVDDWYRSGAKAQRDKLTLLVDCTGCGMHVHVSTFGHAPPQEVEPSLDAQGGDDPDRPFLVVHTDPTGIKRIRRRAVECSGPLMGQCCKQRFYVSFSQLGWDDWIIAPQGYYANYCRGDCGAGHRTPDTFLNYYTHVIEEYRKMDRLAGMQPCCAPLKFSSISLIYYGPDSNIIKRDLPKMVVDECGCP